MDSCLKNTPKINWPVILWIRLLTTVILERNYLFLDNNNQKIIHRNKCDKMVLKYKSDFRANFRIPLIQFLLFHYLIMQQAIKVPVIKELKPLSDPLLQVLFFKFFKNCALRYLHVSSTFVFLVHIFDYKHFWQMFKYIL